MIQVFFISMYVPSTFSSYLDYIYLRQTPAIYNKTNVYLILKLKKCHSTSIIYCTIYMQHTFPKDISLSINLNRFLRRVTRYVPHKRKELSTRVHPLVFSGVWVAQTLNFCVSFYGPFIIFLSLFRLPLHCLSFLD